MTFAWSALQVYDIQGRIANHALRTQVGEAETMLKRKEDLSLLLDKVANCKGQGVSKVDIDAIVKACKDLGINHDSIGWDGEKMKCDGGANGGVAWMNDPNNGDQKANSQAWDSLTSSIQHELDRTGDRLNSKNSKMEIYKAEAQDAEARYSKGVTAIGEFLGELRRG